MNNPSFSLTGRTALVTGAGQGIGKALALGLSQAGARVVATDIVEEPAALVADEIRAKGGHGMGCALDVSQPDAIDSVLQLLFWPAAAEDYSVPRTFWDTDLGRMLALAKYRAYEPTELVSIGNAAQQLGVTRPTIYRWMDDRTLNYVRDDMSGRTFVVRRDIDHLKRVAQEFEGQI